MLKRFGFDPGNDQRQRTVPCLLNKNEFAHAYSPYRKEARYCLIVDLIISVFGCVLVFYMYALVNKTAIWLLGAFPSLLIIESFVNYRLAILSLIEEKHQLVVQKTVTLGTFKKEDSASSHWGSIIPKLYPKEMNMQRYKMRCIDTNGEKLTLRCAMSLRNAILFDKMMEDETTRKRTLIIGKYSRIILKYCDNDDFAFILSRRL